jgi:sugar fermentation stimulation protein A
LQIAHPRPLLEGRFRARYDRFIAAIELQGHTIEAHCVNPGRMEGMLRDGARAWVSKAPADSRRKLRYTLELLEVDGIIVGANTQTPNRLAETLIRARCIPGLRRFRSLRREVPYGGHSRIDLLLESSGRDHLVEVKNCHLVYPDGGAYFPDSVSARATGHLQALAREVALGRRATVLFVVQRDDATFLRPSALHDPAFAAAAQQAARAGVRFRAVSVGPTHEAFVLARDLPVDLRPYDEEALERYRRDLLPFSGWQRRGNVSRGPRDGAAGQREAGISR